MGADFFDRAVFNWESENQNQTIYLPITLTQPDCLITFDRLNQRPH